LFWQTADQRKTFEKATTRAKRKGLERTYQLIRSERLCAEVRPNHLHLSQVCVCVGSVAHESRSEKKQSHPTRGDELALNDARSGVDLEVSVMDSKLVLEKYEIQHRIAVGGMGEVFYALQKVGPERPVILKSLLPELAEQKTFVDQFLDEARLAATLKHPNVVSIIEVGQWNGNYFIVMEYIGGRNLAQLMRKATDLQVSVPVSVALKVIRDAASGLDHAHCATDSQGRPLNIVHRDVSPQNIMVRDDGVTKLLDFGIARASDRPIRTAAGILKGKPSYMAPEQLMEGYVGPRTDQFALGVVLWELLCNRGLFRADREAELMKKVLEAPIAKPSSMGVVDASVDAVVMRMLERESSRRFDSCSDVSKALDRLLAAMTGKVESPGEFLRRLGTGEGGSPRFDTQRKFSIDVKSPPSQSFLNSYEQRTPSLVSSQALNRSTPVTSSPAAVPPKSTPVGKDVRPLILYIEDDPSNFEVAELRLGKRFRLLHASTDVTACRLLEQHQTELAAVLMDIELKGSNLDGIALTKLIRGKGPSTLPDFAKRVAARTTPVFIVTAFVGQYPLELLTAAGADNAFTKPVDFVKLSLALATASAKAVIGTLNQGR
jgi:serine/threonine protein kinase